MVVYFNNKLKKAKAKCDVNVTIFIKEFLNFWCLSILIESCLFLTYEYILNVFL